MLKAVHCTMGGNQFLSRDWLGPTLEKAGYKLVVISEWDSADVKFDLNTYKDEMKKCDVCLCPQRVSIQPAKSNVKLTQAMSLQLPVIASDLQSYKEIIVNGVNGYICSTLEEWYVALMLLKDDNHRKDIAQAGYYTVKDRFSVSTITDQWVKLVKEQPRTIAPIVIT